MVLYRLELQRLFVRLRKRFKISPQKRELIHAYRTLVGSGGNGGMAPCPQLLAALTTKARSTVRPSAASVPKLTHAHARSRALYVFSPALIYGLCSLSLTTRPPSPRAAC